MKLIINIKMKDKTGTFVPMLNITYKLINNNIIIGMLIYFMYIRSIGSNILSMLPTTLADKNHPTLPSLLCQ